MDNPPAYDSRDFDSSWPSEKDSRDGKEHETRTHGDPLLDESSSRGRLLLENLHHRNHTVGMELVPAGNRTFRLSDDYESNTDLPIQDTRSPTAYFRPQATLDQPLDIDLDTYRQQRIQSQDNNIQGPGTQARSMQSALALIRPGMSKDEQVDIVLSRHPDMHFEKLLQLLEDIELPGCNIEPIHTDTQDGTHQINHLDKFDMGHMTAPAVLKRHSLPDQQSDNNDIDREVMLKPSQQSVSSNQTAKSYELTHHIQPWTQNQRHVTAAEREEKDFQLAIQLSQQDSRVGIRPSHSSTFSEAGQNTADSITLASANSARHLSGNTAIHMRRVTDQTVLPSPATRTFSLGQQDVPLRVPQNDATASALGIPNNGTALQNYGQEAAPIMPLPLFPGGVSTSHLSRFSATVGPLANREAEQQALSDSVAMHNLHAQRQADRILAERNFTHHVQSQPQNDRAIQAAVALARESLADSRVQTSLTSREVLQRNIQETRLQTAKDELAQIQRREEMELQKQQRMHEDALRSQEAAERRRALDHKRQAEHDLRREQEEADARFAIELERMQHEQTMEKIDAFSRAVDQPVRRKPRPQLRSQTLDFSVHETPSGSVRELSYGSGDDYGRADDSNSDYRECTRGRQSYGRY